LRKAGKLKTKLRGKVRWRLFNVVLNTRLGTFSCSLEGSISKELSLLHASMELNPIRNCFSLTIEEPGMYKHTYLNQLIINFSLSLSLSLCYVGAADAPPQKQLPPMFNFKTETREEFSSWVRHLQHAIMMARYYREEIELITEVPCNKLLCLVHIPSVPVPAVWAGGTSLPNFSSIHINSSLFLSLSLSLYRGRM